MMRKPDGCRGCPFYGSGDGFVPPHGPEDAALVMLAESPGENEERDGVPLVGRAGQQFDLACRVNKIKRADTLIVNTILCRPPRPASLDDKAWQGAIAHCWEAHTGPLFDRVKPRAVLAMGSPAMFRVTGMRTHTVTHGERRFTMNGIEAVRGSAWRASELAAGGPVRVSERPLMLPKWGGGDPWVVATLHPAYIARGNFHLKNMWWADFGRVKRLSEGNPRDWGRIDLSRVELDARGPVPKEWDHITFDTETNSRDEVDILGVGCGEEVKVYSGAQMVNARAALRLRETPKVAHNFGFDVRMLGGCEKVRGPWVDTIVAAHVVQPALPKSLASVASLYAGDGYFYWKDMCDNPRTWAAVAARLGIQDPLFPSRRQLYNAMDVWWTDRAWAGLRRELRHYGVVELFTKTQMPLLPCLVDVERVGMPVDRVAFDGERERVEAELSTHVADVLRMVEARIGARRERMEAGVGTIEAAVDDFTLAEGGCGEHPEFMGRTKRKKCTSCLELWGRRQEAKARWGKELGREKARLKRVTSVPFRVTSDDDWRWLLFTKKPEGLGLRSGMRTGTRTKPSLNKNALRAILALAGLTEEARAFVMARFRIGQLESRLGKYLNPENIAADGRIHPPYMMHGTLTGRSSSGFDDTDADKPNSRFKVNAQNWPPDVRRVVGTRGLGEEWWLVNADYSAIEAWTSAIRVWQMTGRREYWDFLVHTKDPHALTAERVEALSGTHVSRYQGKRTRHMWTYCAGPKMMAIVLAGDGVTFEIAKASHAALSEMHPDIIEWWEKQAQAVRRAPTVRNPLGRMLHVSLQRASTPEGVDVVDHNSLIAWWPQSTAHEISKHAWVRMRKEFGPEFVINHAHDDFTGLTRENPLEVAAQLKRVMEQPVGWLVTPDGEPFQPRVEVRVGRNWGEWHEHGEECEAEPFKPLTAPGCSKWPNSDGLKEVEG